jgi:hypothetical protein
MNATELVINHSIVGFERGMPIVKFMICHNGDRPHYRDGRKIGGGQGNSLVVKDPGGSRGLFSKSAGKC